MELGDLVARLQALSQSDPDRRIYVRGDKTVAYGRMIEVMGTIKQGGFTKVALLVEQAEGAPGSGTAGHRGAHGAARARPLRRAAAPALIGLPRAQQRRPGRRRRSLGRRAFPDPGAAHRAGTLPSGGEDAGVRELRGRHRGSAAGGAPRDRVGPGAGFHRGAYAIAHAAQPAAAPAASAAGRGAAPAAAPLGGTTAAAGAAAAGAGAAHPDAAGRRRPPWRRRRGRRRPRPRRRCPCRRRRCRRRPSRGR